MVTDRGAIAYFVISFIIFSGFVLPAKGENSPHISDERDPWTDEDDLVFIHHSVGRNWLSDGLNSALIAKSYIDERNDIYYGTDLDNNSGRPKSIASDVGNYTEMRHWILWFNDYLDAVLDHDCADGVNRIVMFKSCYPASKIGSSGTEPGDPFSSTKSMANYKAVFRHYSGDNKTYSSNGYTYLPLDRVFASNPNTLFIYVTSPPLHYSPWDATSDTEAARARDFTDWVKNDWLNDYNRKNPGLNNVAVYDFFNFLAYPDDHASHPNRLKKEYGGETGNSHPNKTANQGATADFAGKGAFLDNAWAMFNRSIEYHQWGGSRRDRMNTGRSPYGHDFERANYRWKFSSGGEIHSSPAIDREGRIYFGSDDGKLYALYPNGSLIWSFKTSGKIRSSPNIDHSGVIYFGSDDGRFYALYPNGSQLWNFTTGDKVRSSPNIDHSGVVYFGSDDGKLYALFPNGSQAWNLSTGGKISSKPAIDYNGIVYVSSDNGRLHSVEINGTLRFTINITGPGTPAINGNGQIVVGSSNGRVYELDDSGKIIWNYTSIGADFSSPSIDFDGYLIVSDQKGYVLSIFNGSLNWRKSMGGNVSTPPVINNGSKVYFGMENGRVVSLNPNGTHDWNLSLDDRITSGPVIDSDGRIYAATENGTLYCIGITKPTPPTSAALTKFGSSFNITWGSPLNDGGSTVTRYVVLRSMDGESYSSIDETELMYYNDTSSKSNSLYFYHVKAVNSVGQSEPSITMTGDHKRPVLAIDSTPVSGTTGDPLTFKASFSDDSGISEVYLVVTIPGNGSYNLTMVPGTEYQRTIIVSSDTTSSISYRFVFSDKVGNWNQTTNKQITVYDNDPPEFIQDGTPKKMNMSQDLWFNVSVSDNIQVSSVYVEYWFGSGSHTNVSMSGTGPYTYKITIPSDMKDNLHYIFHAVDNSGNWAHTSQKDISIFDNDRPTFGTDSTPSSGTTGESLTFSISVSDNIGVSSVFVEYWFGSGSHTNVSMSGSGPYTYQITILSSSTDTLHYIFHAVDTSGNWAHTSQKNVTITDNDKPTFGTDSTPSSGTTGDSFTFSISVSDNIDVSSVNVEYWFGSGSHTNVSMSGSGPYTYQITILSSSTDTLHYIFHAVDTSGNWAHASQKDVTITDNDKPTFGTDNTPSSGTTGDPFTFNISVTDNIGVSSVFVEYWFGTGEHDNVSMNGSRAYIFQITMPSNSTDTLHYIFHAVDGFGNWNDTIQKDVLVSDNDRPVFGTDATPGSARTGEEFTFSIMAWDNIAISFIYLEYRFGTGDHNNVSMEESGPYTYRITIPSNSTDTLHYLFIAVDQSGNWANTLEMDVIITDEERPTFGSDDTSHSGTTGDPFTFSISVTDNIGVSSVFVEYWFGTGEHYNESMNGWGPYTYQITISSHSTETLHYIFHAVDGSGNWNDTIQKDVLVSDNDKPFFGTDETPASAMTGNRFTFSIMAWDNIAISFVHVEYWFGTGEHYNMSMNGSGPYTYRITIPSHSTDVLHYLFHAVDEAGNRAHTLERTVAVLDDDVPVFGSDSTPISGTTGDLFMFNISVTDNIGVSSVFVEYWFGTGEHNNMSMTGSGHYIYQMIIPFDSIDPLHYIFHAVDDSLNRNHTIEITVTIEDNKKPIFLSDQTPSEAYTGENIIFNISVTDNIGLSMVYLEYWFGEGEHYNVSMEGSHFFMYDLSLPLGSNDVLYYIFRAVDPFGNWNMTKQKEIVIHDEIMIDDESPTSDAGPDRKVPAGTIVELDGSGSKDNVGIVNWTWSFNDGSRDIVIYGAIAYHNFSIPGNYSIGLNVTDEAGNYASDHFLLTVEPIINGNGKIDEGPLTQGFDIKDLWWLALIIIAWMIMLIIGILTMINKKKDDQAVSANLSEVTSFDPEPVNASEDVDISNDGIGKEDPIDMDEEIPIEGLELEELDIPSVEEYLSSLDIEDRPDTGTEP
ncbi:MAG: PQQ-binding-like beta-propeller repeat protein [Candidatus Thermoplasmatota archaeon]|nr:PQQ-binding-like beta-propeller repeat protein [Candidatus Thermoplasmatota archaeon]